MDRFEQGLRDAQQAPVGTYCDECGGEIYKHDEYYMSSATEHERFCSVSCLLDAIGLAKKEA